MKILCKLCGKEVITKFSGTKYCPECSKTVERQRKAQYAKNRKLREKQALIEQEILSRLQKVRTIKCARCGKSVEAIHSGTRYCSECSPIVSKEKERERHRRSAIRAAEKRRLEKAQKIRDEEKAAQAKQKEEETIQTATRKKPCIVRRHNLPPYAELVALRHKSIGEISRVAKQYNISYGILANAIPH